MIISFKQEAMMPHKCRQKMYVLSSAIFIFCLVIICGKYKKWALGIINQFDIKLLSTVDEKGLYNFTVVTAMLDIGRGSWPNQKRTYETYLANMRPLLKLNVNILAFVDQRAKEFIEEHRKGKERRTHTTAAQLKELPYFRFRDRIAEIMNSSQYQKYNELFQQKLCEAYVPDYDILQLSKLYLMDRAVRENPFNTTYFMWMDGGYGHGNDVYPKDNMWMPKGLFEHSDKVTFIDRHPGVRAFQMFKSWLHKMSINILVGGFIAGGGEAFKELYEMQKQKVDEWMRHGVVDDDQTMYMLLYYKKPSLFHLVPGDWYEVFKLFNKSMNEDKQYKHWKDPFVQK